ncbi:DUF1592 domain-containing protein [Rhodopirellula sp.]|nr:DUF1592 domain-containing protein [Rhodopirellula sp.]MDB4678918.1 DUF1592 domain-containing protein [Rhodopirellula sp.]
MQIQSKLLVLQIGLWAYLIIARPSAIASEIPDSVQALLSERCLDCHSANERSGGINIETLLNSFAPDEQLRDWEKIDAAIAKGKMPPVDESTLDKPQRKTFKTWFEREFVKPGGTQHAGPVRPRRLTREELQNTLEDILHVRIRAQVTNSRLHIIPDTIIEKFFTTGIRGDSGFSNDAVTLGKESIDIQTYARCFSLVLSLLDNNEQSRIKLFGVSTLPEKLAETESMQIIEKFGRVAFRRPLTATERSGFQAAFRKMASDRTTYEAMKSTFVAVLLSPSFLYRFETPLDGQVPVGGDELATRLSYFLWSAPPDETLRHLAKSGQLRDPDVLRQQTRRMLADPKRIALAENFGGEWFDYKSLRQKSFGNANRRSDKMAGFYRTQYEEALLFFDSIIRFDQSIFRLIDADWAFLNRHQIGIYQLGAADKSFAETNSLPPISVHFRSQSRQVQQGNYEYKHLPLTPMKLTDENRGGLITLGPTMTITSTENRTSPIRRGVWVMERILGEHFELPEDVPDLEETQKKLKTQNLTHVEILKAHSSQTGCASCHQYIDPVGFGLEMFDQLGIARSLPLTGEKLYWTSEQTPQSYADRTWELKEPLTPGAQTQIFFQYSKGGNRLDIRNVRLVAKDTQLVDEHFGYAGNAQQNNTWSFTLPTDATKLGWQLIAEIKGNGGNNSFGTITVAGADAKGAGFRLPNGNSFANPAELKHRLVTDYRDQFIDNAVRRTLAYALGRQLRPIDRPAIQQISEAIQDDNYQMNALLEAVVLSYPFLHKEN